MGRKKGKQAGLFMSKSQNAAYRHTVYVDRASEANQYRNPIAQIGRGYGYRNASPQNGDAGDGGRWCRNGNGYGGGDKWSSIFSSSRSSSTNCARSHRPDGVGGSGDANRATMGLSRLRHLLEERRSEDRIHDRQHRLRIQRSRIMENRDDGVASNVENTKNIVQDRHDPGWLLSYSLDNHNRSQEILGMEQNNMPQTDFSGTIEIPSLQKLAAQMLGPLLPMYCAACGSEFVGECLKSVPAHVLSDLAVSLAKTDWSSGNESHFDGTKFATTDGAVKALVHSGVATGLVLRGAPLLPPTDCPKSKEEGDDARWLSDDGLLALCPRIDGDLENEDGNIGLESSCDHWELLDFDIGLNARMSGCFHLKRLELIDLPLQNGSSGISIRALRAVLRSCPNITHLSLSGCFHNWEDSDCLTASVSSAADDINMLLSGNPSSNCLTRSLMMLSKIHGHEEGSMNLIPELSFHQMFQNVDDNQDIPGLDVLLPELQVLDLSQCSWCFPSIVQYLVMLWGRALAPSSIKTGDSNSNDSRWIEDEENSGSGAIKTAHGGDGHELTNNSGNQGNQARSPDQPECPPKINTTLRHLNIRGCVSSSPLWVEKWREYGLFDGIDVSTDRQDRQR